ncbi:prolyl oligopeptidase family serine peptidase [Selenomonas ruminantium]|uniref:prolyl oligopeptidase family serine peptidase n=1 Tax=Selenomonas ruminantium TaxID=971 RepID=UPI0026F0BB83|nr:prolyl oligopeptidase family serine peptidase [Selenomonas ruminantium]
MMISKKLKRAVRLGLCGVMLAGFMMAGDIASAAVAQQPSYKTVTETFDWGPSVSKVIVNLGSTVKSSELNTGMFKVHVRRELAEGAITPAEAMREKKDAFISLGAESTSNKDIEGDRQVTKAYVSDAQGNPVDSGEYVTLEMAVSPTDTLGAALNFDLHTLFNNWVKPHYTITDGNRLVVDNNQGDIRPQADKFKYNHKLIGIHDSFPYASFEPEQASAQNKKPLIIWLHGMGEGGNSPSLPIMGNKATQFADASIQKYFDGAYVLAPQARTYWMHGYNGFADGTSIYSKTLMEMIKAYVAEHPGVDENRIYVGGDSNGGYMTMLLVRDNPGFFAAAFPTCEGLKDSLISKKDLANIAKTPIWFTAAKTDTVLPPKDYAVPTVERLKKAGADVHFSYFDNVVDTSGKYKKADGTPYEYMGHWSWIYVYNDQCEDTINGKSVKLFQWMAEQKRK